MRFLISILYSNNCSTTLRRSRLRHRQGAGTNSRFVEVDSGWNSGAAKFLKPRMEKSSCVCNLRQAAAPNDFPNPCGYWSLSQRRISRRQRAILYLAFHLWHTLELHCTRAVTEVFCLADHRRPFARSQSCHQDASSSHSKPYYGAW